MYYYYLYIDVFWSVTFTKTVHFDDYVPTDGLKSQTHEFKTQNHNTTHAIKGSRCFAQFTIYIQYVRMFLVPNKPLLMMFPSQTETWRPIADVSLKSETTLKRKLCSKKKENKILACFDEAAAAFLVLQKQMRSA